MKMKTKGKLYVINVGYVLCLALVCAPLLMLAKYNYPSADDWSYGANIYHVLREGGGLREVIGAASLTVRQAYLGWDGRFFAAFMDAFQPGSWGNYWLTTWMALGMLVFSEILFARYFIVGMSQEKSLGKCLFLPIILPILLVQILYCPSPVESFYWYSGAMNYTFVYGLSLLLFVVFCSLAKGVEKFRIMTGVFAGVLAVAVGGANFSTSLSMLLSLFTLLLVFVVNRKWKAVRNVWYIPVLLAVGLCLCVFSPGSAAGNAGRMGAFRGVAGAIEAVLLSVWRTFTNICSWTGIVVIMAMILILPVAYMAVKNMSFHFHFPLLFTGVSFCVSAAQMVPNIYAQNSAGGGRNAAIYYYFYLLFMLANEIYWMGWLCRKRWKLPQNVKRIVCFVKKHWLSGIVIVGCTMVVWIYSWDLRRLSSYNAYRDWRQGWAQQYAAEWKARLEVLHDDSVKDVVFEPLSVYPEMILYTDLQDENGYIWVNSACAEYYDKASITVKTPTQ